MKRPAALGVALALVALACHSASTRVIDRGDPVAFDAGPAVQVAPDGATFTEISVLTYNVRAFPWPLRLDGAGAMKEIGRQLHVLRAQGRAPDVILIQEGFSDDAQFIAERGGYPYRAHGPTRADAMAAADDDRAQALRAGADWTKGETLGPVLGSGLHVFSRYPITETEGAAFGRHACAGYDCLAGKGVLAARVAIPGVPGGVVVFTTHLNANKRAGVSQARSGRAYEGQLARVRAFIDDTIAADVPVIFGGDFNIKNQAARREQAALTLASFSTVHRYCDDNAAQCRQTYHGDRRSGWLEPRDVQGFRDGARVRVQPLDVAALFDGGDDGPMLSDHVGYLVKYRLTWRAADEEATDLCF